MKKFNYLNESKLKSAITEKHHQFSGVLFDHVDDANLAYIAIKPNMSQSHHYHKEGADIFIIISGVGTLRYCDVYIQSGCVSNTQSTKVKSGDVYFVAPYQMHALYNDSSPNSLVFLNVAPNGHNQKDNFDV